MFNGIRIGIPSSGGLSKAALLAGYGLTAFKDFRGSSESADLDFGKGTKTGTYTASRSASAPATYYDANGNIQLLTTANTPRYMYGYYDETGFKPLAKKALMLEGACTQLLVNSTMNSGSATLQTTGFDLPSGTRRWTAGVAGTGAMTFAFGGSLYGTSKGMSVTVTNSGASATDVIFRGSTTNNLFTVVSGQRYTLSFHYKCNTAGKVIPVDIVNSAVANLGLNSSFTTVADTWCKVFFQFTASSSDATGIVRFLLGNIGTFNITFDAFMLCTSASTTVNHWPCTFVPTTTEASGTVTRPQETLTYPAADNYPAPTGNNTLSFDGSNDFVSVPDSAAGNQIFGATSFSVEAWVFNRTAGETNAGMVIGKAGAAFTVGYALYNPGATSQLTFSIFEGTVRKDTTASTGLGTNIWRHIVVSWTSGSSPKIYIDGTETGYALQTAVTTPDNDSAVAAYIGNRQANDRTLDGFIRRVRIFRNKALSAGDVTTLYNSGTYIQNQASPVSGCTAEYNFTDGSGNTLTDSSGNANNGTNSGATWVKDTHQATVLLKMRPVSQPSEMTTSAGRIFSPDNASTNSFPFWKLVALAGNNLRCTIISNSAVIDTGSYAPNFTRYLSYSNALVSDTSQSTKFILYQGGVSRSTATTYPIPIVPSGVTTLNFILSNGQAWMVEAIAVFNRGLTAAEVAKVNTIIG